MLTSRKNEAGQFQVFTKANNPNNVTVKYIDCFSKSQSVNTGTILKKSSLTGQTLPWANANAKDFYPHFNHPLL